MTRHTKEDRITLAMFGTANAISKRKQTPLTAKELEIKTRYEGAFTFWLANPWASKGEVARFIKNTFNVKKTIAYQDVAVIEAHLGNIAVASKEWLRYMVTEMNREAYLLAKSQKNPVAMTLAADKIGKHNNLDKLIADAIPHDQIIPPDWEPAADPSILGIEAASISEKVRIKLRNQYLKKYLIGKVTEAEIIDES